MEIYKITNMINSKIYIGATTRTKEKRFSEHLRVYPKLNYAIYRAFRKYGIENFKLEQVEFIEDIETLIIRESYWIKLLNSMNPNIGYNMINQESSVKVFSDEIKEKLSISQRKRINKLSKEAKNEIYLKSSLSKQGKLRYNSKTGFCGVTCAKCDRYSCEISYTKNRYRRIFVSVTEAAEDYDKLALYLYGEDATLNFPHKKSIYLEEDLILFVDWFINYPQKQGKPAKQLYNYNELLEESKLNAKMEINKYNINNIVVPDLLYQYNGKINPEFLLKYQDD